MRTWFGQAIDYSSRAARTEDLLLLAISHCHAETAESITLLLSTCHFGRLIDQLHHLILPENLLMLANNPGGFDFSMEIKPNGRADSYQ
jgi:hypothetical protein